MSTIHAWLPLALSLLAFALSHIIPTLPAVRARLIGLCGRRIYFLAYGLTSLVLLACLVGTASSAPYVELWSPTEHLLWVPRVAMLPAVVLAVYGLMAPNPLSLTINRREKFDPDRPGVVGVVRHPVLWAMLIWSASHVLANGAVAHVLLFGTFAVMSVQGMVATDRRRQSKLGLIEWRRLSARAHLWPLLPSLLAGWRPAPSLKAVWPFLLGIATYAALALGHTWFAGVPSYP